MIIRNTHKEPTFNCGRRAENGPMPPAEEVRDGWNIEPNGDKTCSYCGSLSEEDFQDILKRYAAGEEGYHFEPTEKGYKWYAQRPGVKNASEGGIKFYSPHVDLVDKDGTLPERERVYREAMETYRKNLRERMKPRDGGKA